MRTSVILIIFLFVLNSCGDKNETSGGAKDTGKKNEKIDEQHIECLRKKTTFDNTPPVDIEEVVYKFSNTYKQCDATLEEIKKFSQEIVIKYGDI